MLTSFKRFGARSQIHPQIGDDMAYTPPFTMKIAPVASGDGDKLFWNVDILTTKF